MKKYIGILSAMLLCALLALSAFAAETVVYVNDGGSGDGSSASAPLGDMTEAINKVANGGKVVIVDTYTCADEFHEPTHKGDITVTGGNYVFTNGKYNRWFLSGSGATTFENITFTYGEGSTALFVAQFNPITFGEGVTTPTSGVYLVGGYQQVDGLPIADSPDYSLDSHVVVKSGTFHAVVGVSRGAGTNEYTGTGHVTVDGGTIATLYGASINGNYSTNSELIINGGTISNLKTAGDSSRRLNGDSTVTVNGGSIGMLSVNNVMGHATVNYNGGSIAMAEKTVSDSIMEFVTDGTATLIAAPGLDVKLLSLFFDEVQTGAPASTTAATTKVTEPEVTTKAPEVTSAETTAATTAAKTADAVATEETIVASTDVSAENTTVEDTTAENTTAVGTSAADTSAATTEASKAESTEPDKSVDTTVPETTASLVSEEGGVNVGLIVGIVVAVLVVAAVIVVIVKKNK